MSSINRWNRSAPIDRGGELPESLSPVRNRQLEQPPVEAIPRLQNRLQDGFDSANQRLQDGFEASGKKPPVELGFFDKLLTSADFQQRLQEALEGTSARAQQVKQVESTYKAFWQDSQDFTVRNQSGPALSVPEPPRYVAPAETAWKGGREMTVPNFNMAEAEAARVQQAAQASATLQQSRRVAAVAEPFSLLGRAMVRA